MHSRLAIKERLAGASTAWSGHRVAWYGRREEVADPAACPLQVVARYLGRWNVEATFEELRA